MDIPSRLNLILGDIYEKEVLPIEPILVGNIYQVTDEYDFTDSPTLEIKSVIQRNEEGYSDGLIRFKWFSGKYVDSTSDSAAFAFFIGNDVRGTRKVIRIK